jgi:hypothetical protein
LKLDAPENQSAVLDFPNELPLDSSAESSPKINAEIFGASKTKSDTIWRRRVGLKSILDLVEGIGRVVEVKSGTEARRSAMEDIKAKAVYMGGGELGVRTGMASVKLLGKVAASGKSVVVSGARVPLEIEGKLYMLRQTIQQMPGIVQSSGWS